MEDFKEKILENYNYCISNYEKYFRSYHWENQNSSKQNLFKKDNLINFRNNNLSKGLDDQFYSEKDTINFFSSLIEECGEEFVYQALDNKNIGNVKNVFYYRDKFYSTNELFHIKFAKILKQYNAIKLNQIVCEIGPGYGSLINKLLKIINFKAILIDLPEANFISSFFLKSLYPKKNFFLSIDIKNKKITKEDILKNDIIILCPWDEIPEINIDLFINTRSMMEMNYETIKYYFNLIQSKISNNGFFLCINRYYKDTVGYPVELNKYPYDKKWEIVFSKTSWKQNHIHTLLTKRIKLEKDDIKNELKKIEKISLDVKNKDSRFIRRNLPVWLYKFYKKIKFGILRK